MNNIEKIQFKYPEDGKEIVRKVILYRLKYDTSWKQWGGFHGFDNYVDFINKNDAAENKFEMCRMEILWELIIEGIIAPGMNYSNLELPWFHVTDFGKKVLETEKYAPHDHDGYLSRLKQDIPELDKVVEVYLSESINCFRKGNNIAAMVMLGVASERVFLLLCESFEEALSDAIVKTKFSKIIELNSIKPKIDFVMELLSKNKKRIPKEVSDNYEIMLTSIYNMIRSQRNELGHPQENPPIVRRDQIYVYLNIFPHYCALVDLLINHLKKNKI